MVGMTVSLMVEKTVEKTALLLVVVKAELKDVYSVGWKVVKMDAVKVDRLGLLMVDLLVD